MGHPGRAFSRSGAELCSAGQVRASAPKRAKVKGEKQVPRLRRMIRKANHSAALGMTELFKRDFGTAGSRALSNPHLSQKRREMGHTPGPSRASAPTRSKSGLWFPPFEKREGWGTHCGCRSQVKVKGVGQPALSLPKGVSDPHRQSQRPQIPLLAKEARNGAPGSAGR